MRTILTPQGPTAPLNANWVPGGSAGPIPTGPPKKFGAVVPHVQQRLSQMSQVAKFLGPGFELMLERQGVSHPAAAYAAIANSFAKHANAAGMMPRQLLMALLAQKRAGNLLPPPAA